MNIEIQELTLKTGENAWYEYDRDGDFLEIFFETGEATCTVELTESVILRFDWENEKPLSLGVIGVSQLLPIIQDSTTHFQLLTEEWSEQTQEKVWKMLRVAPLSEFLVLSSYSPAYTRRFIPTTRITLPLPLKEAA